MHARLYGFVLRRNSPLENILVMDNYGEVIFWTTDAHQDTLMPLFLTVLAILSDKGCKYGKAHYLLYSLGVQTGKLNRTSRDSVPFSLITQLFEDRQIYYL